ncbi:MAG: hypothetical protein JW939_08780 [Candidatus Thermoplasmatota archaeon]|nr:hypothetical protein [Candidatus Thermoplasmatota archaeon]
MDWTGKSFRWISRLAIGFGFGGIILLFVPFICYVAPFLSQAAVLLGLIGYSRYGKQDDASNRLFSLIGMIAGLVGLIIFALMYIFGWTLW